MKNVKLLSVLFLALCSVLPLAAQGLNESFETWPPKGWQLDSVGATEIAKPNGTWSGYDFSTKTDTYGKADITGAPDKAANGNFAACANYSYFLAYGTYGMRTPEMNLSEMKNPRLSFSWAHQTVRSGDNTYMEVFVGYKEADTIRYVSVARIDNISADASWHTFSQNIDRNADYIRVASTKSTGATTNATFVDNFVVADGGEFGVPYDIASSHVTDEAGSLVLKWASANDAAKWNVKVSATEIDPASADGVFKKTVDGTAEVKVTGLETGKTYYVYVQETDGTKSGEWAENTVFCDIAPQTLPVTVDLNSNNGGLGFIQEGLPNTWCIGTAASTDGTAKALYISSDNGASYSYVKEKANAYAYKNLFIPADCNNGAWIEFSYNGGVDMNNTMQIFIISDMSVYPKAGEYFRTVNGQSEQLGERYYVADKETNYTVEIPPVYAGKQVRLVFSWKNNDYTEPGTPAAIYNIGVKKAECIVPKNLKALDTTTDSVTLDWTVEGTATKWRIEYGPYKSFAEGKNKSIDVDKRPPFGIGGLDDCTNYSFIVRAYCGDVESDPTDTLVVATESKSKTAPYSYNFDDITTDMFPAGWKSLSGQANLQPFVIASEYFAHSQPNAMNLLDNDGTHKVTLISPELSDLGSRQYRITFFARIDGMQFLHVGVMSDPTDESTFVELKKYAGVDYPNVDMTTGLVVPAIRHHIIDLNSELITPEHKYVAFRLGDIMGTKYAAIDDFSYEKIPACIEPKDLKPLNVGATSSRFVWTPQNAGQNKWELVWYLGAGLPDDEGGKVGSVVTDKPVGEMTGLEKSTYYSVYVRSVCSEEEKGPWSEAYYFNTCNGNTSMPYTEPFDGFSLLGITPPCWDVEDENSRWELTGEEYNTYSRAVANISAEGEVNDWLFTPSFEMEGGTQYMFSFWVKYAEESTENTISIHYGNTARAASMSKAVYTEAELTDKYKIVKANFVPETSGNYHVGINYKGKESKGLWIDDVMLQKRRSTDVDNVGVSPISLYYQKENRNIYINYEGGVSEVKVYNMLGTLVDVVSDYESGNGIPTANCANGAYIITVTVDGETYVEKLIISM